MLGIPLTKTSASFLHGDHIMLPPYSSLWRLPVGALHIIRGPLVQAPPNFHPPLLLRCAPASQTQHRISHSYTLDMLFHLLFSLPSNSPVSLRTQFQSHCLCELCALFMSPPLCPGVTVGLNKQELGLETGCGKQVSLFPPVTIQVQSESFFISVLFAGPKTAERPNKPSDHFSLSNSPSSITYDRFTIII